MKVMYLLILGLVFSCKAEKENIKHTTGELIQTTSIIILGNVQDAGSPQIGCTKSCCEGLFNNPNPKRKVISLGVVDAKHQNTYLFEASPDIVSQTKALTKHVANKELPDGIFLTHAHIGHYTGLMYLGKEAIDAKQTPVYAMPKMHDYLSTNGPWNQLVERENMVLKRLKQEVNVRLSDSLVVTPFLVPHRDEYSETVGYKITGPSKSALFIPDIDKWEKWEKDIINEISQVDYAFLDATFYSGEEINNRDISQIPHPFIIESLTKFKDLSVEEKAKIIFIHFNHTNPALNLGSKESKHIESLGFKIGRYGDIFTL